jgi:hypothetical protein
MTLYSKEMAHAQIHIVQYFLLSNLIETHIMFE